MNDKRVMKVSLTDLKKICTKNVVELKFIRRNKLRYSPTRRMLCTLDTILLNSDFGKKTLNFKPPRYAPPYDAEARGLLTVWDIIMQDWRNVPVDACDLVVAVPTQPQNEFLKFFDKKVAKMSSVQKKGFMDK